MAGNQKYKVIVADRAKRMSGAHIRFLAQANKDAAVAAKKKILAPELHSLSEMPHRYPFFDEVYVPKKRPQKKCVIDEK